MEPSTEPEITSEVQGSPSGEPQIPARGDEMMISTIVRLPLYIRDANKDLFEPRVISIGPYHRGNVSTHEMEAHKEHFLRSFLQRPGNVDHQPHIDIAEITSSCIAQARRCYSENMVDDYTAEMLMVDGCFIIELLLRWKEGKVNADKHVRLMWNNIYYDLLLIDNQIPFFVLDKLFGYFKERTAFEDDLLHLVVNFFVHDGQFSWAKFNPEDLPMADQVCHLLDLQHKLAMHSNTGFEPKLNTCPFMCRIDIIRPSPMPRGIPGAKELKDYGVRFKKDKERKKFHVTFQGNTMTIPCLQINSGSKILLTNLFAYDQIEGQRGNKFGAVTSYVVLMNALIQTGDDVLVLQQKGILEKDPLLNENEVASFFNELGRCAFVDVNKPEFTEIFDNVNRFRWKLCDKIRYYVRNHSLRLAAIYALIFLFITMFYTIRIYYRVHG
uniref:Uncharacterized protein n=1 Tax=Oryza punctata TaxID=4537 RepID=A0A0E0MMX6_ORYPU